MLRHKSAIPLFVIFSFIILTVFSRVLDSFTIAKVDLEDSLRNSLTYNINGSGIILSQKQAFQYAYPGLRISEIFVGEGMPIAEKDKIASVDSYDLTQKIKELRIQIRKSEIQIAKIDIESTALLPLERQTSNSLTYLEEDLKVAKDNLKIAQSNYTAAQNNSHEKLLESKKIAYEEAEAALQLFLAEYNSTVELSQDAYKKAEYAYQKHPKLIFDTALSAIKFDENGKVIRDDNWLSFLNLYQYNTSEDKLALLENTLSEYHSGIKQIQEVYYAVSGTNNYGDLAAQFEALVFEKDEKKKMFEQTEAIWNQKKNIENQKKEKALSEYNKIKEGKYEIASEIENEKQSIELLKNKIIELERSIESTNISSEQTETTADNNTKVKNLEKEALLLDLDLQKQALSDLEALQQQDNNILAILNGKVESIFIKAGDRITDEGLLSVSSGEFQYEAIIDSEYMRYITIGDTIQIKQPGKQKPIEGTIIGISISDIEASGKITSSLPEGDYCNGTPASFEIKKTSVSYPNCIALSALHQDQNGYYLLAAEEENTFLGTQLVAARRDILLLEKDNVIAAIDSNGFSLNNIIVSSNKEVKLGDRIRKRN